MSQLAGHLDSPVHPTWHRPPLLGKGLQEVPRPGGGHRLGPGEQHQVLSPTQQTVRAGLRLYQVRVSNLPLPPGLPTRQPPKSHVRAISPRPARQGSALGNEYEHDPPAADGSSSAGLEILNSWAQDTSGRLKFLLLPRKELEQEPGPRNSRTRRGLMEGGAAEGPGLGLRDTSRTH